MKGLTQTTLGLWCAALGMSQVFAAEPTEIDMTCDREKPVIMLVAGRTLDAERMRDYAIALGSSDLYPNAQGYYMNIPRPVRILEGEPDADDVAPLLKLLSRASYRKRGRHSKPRPRVAVHDNLKIRASASDTLADLNTRALLHQARQQDEVTDPRAHARHLEDPSQLQRAVT